MVQTCADAHMEKLREEETRRYFGEDVVEPQDSESLTITATW